MALVIKDRVKQTTTTTGTGTLTLNGTVDGFQTFAAALSDGDTTYYALLEPSTNEWEVGLGTWTEGSSLLARTTVLASSNSGSAVNLTAQAEVFISQPAGKAAFFNADGDLELNRDPVSALQAATKEYVDTIAAAGLHYHDPVRVEREGNLSATYDNGTSGVGATLTNNSTQEAITIDGVALSLNDRVLLYEQTDATQNGIYTVTTVGSASTNWVLTRATDADSYGASDPDALGQGDAFFVLEGTEGAGELYVMNTEREITFGTTNITFTQVAATAVYTAGTGITQTGTEFSIGQDVATTADVTFNSVDADLAKAVTTANDIYPASANDYLGSNSDRWAALYVGDIVASGAGKTAYFQNVETFGTLDVTGKITATGGLDAPNNIALTNSGFSHTLLTDTLSSNTLTVFDATGGYVAYTDVAQTLSNKTLDAPIISDNIIFEGATDDAFETTLTVGDPTGDRTITLPDASGTVALEGADVSFNSVDADLSATVTYAKDIVPVTDGVYSLGTYSTHWGAVYADTIVSYTTAFLTDVTVNGEITFEGSTADANETVLTVTDPTADRTITLPDKTGTVAVYSADGTSGQVLTTDGSGNLSFTTVSGGGGGDMSWQSAWPDDTDTTNGGNIPIGEGSLAVVQSGAQGNVAIGKDALNDLTTADFNTGSGYRAGSQITTGSSNTAVGKDALFQSTTGAYNTAIGDQALYSNTTGSYKTAIGYAAGLYDTIDSGSTYVGAQTAGTAYTTNGVAIGYQAKLGGNTEVAIGYQAGAYQTSNDFNVYVGAYAGNYNTSSKDSQTYIGYSAGNDAYGDNSVAVGAYSLSDGNHYRAVAVGYDALGNSSTSSPYYNICVGYAAGNGIYSGDGNIYMGYSADMIDTNDSYAIGIGYNARSTDYSVSIGYQAMGSAIAGSDYNTCVGSQAGYDLDGGDHNSFVGNQSGFNGGTGSFNNGLGRKSLYSLTSGANNNAVGASALEAVTEGIGNCAIGGTAGQILTTGDYNTLVGHNAGYYQDTGN